jgi:Mg/Co/Ni transporter MgtE/phage gp45-like
MDTNDPQSRGRFRVYCPDFGDLPSTPKEDLPWCRYMTPFGGMISSDKMGRGPSDHTTKGGVAYGMWSIPKVGTEVIISCINGDPCRRIFIGCLTPDKAEHTLPHGRTIDGDGPFSSEEHPIEPLYSNMKKAFGSEKSPEFKSRGPDSSVTGVTPAEIQNDETASSSPDTKVGFKQSRLHPDEPVKDSQIYSLTSPGFHAISLDDSIDNGRIRIRSSSGHSIIMDDSNERIYINTAEGNSWIELDQDGTIDIYSAKSISVYSETDMNFTAKKSIRFDAENIYANTTKDVKITAKNNVNVEAVNTTFNSKSKFSIKSARYDLKSKKIQSSSATSSFNASSSMRVSGGSGLALRASGITSSVPIRKGGGGGGGSYSSGDSSDSSAIPQPKAASPAIAASLQKTEGADKGHVMKNMPSDTLGDTLKNMPPEESGKLLSSVDDEDMPGVIDNIPSDDLKELMPKIPANASTNVLRNMDSKEMADMFTDMESSDIDDVFSKMDGNQAGEILDKLNNDNVESPLSMMSSKPLGEVLKTLPPDTLNTTLSDLPKTNIDNLPINDVSEMLHKSPNPGQLAQHFQPSTLGSAMGGLHPNKISSILDFIPDSLKPDVLAHTPAQKLSAVNSDVLAMRPNLPEINLGDFHKNVPNDLQEHFSQHMSAPDLGHSMRSLPTSSLDGIMSGMSPNMLNNILPALNGPDLGHIMSNVSNPGSILSSISGDHLPEMMRVMPGGNITSMLGNMRGGDITSMFSSLGGNGVGNMISSVPGGDMMKMFQSYSGALGNFQGLSGCGELLGNMQGRQIGQILNNIPLGNFGNIMNAIPNANMMGMLSKIDPNMLGNVLSGLPMPQMNDMLCKLNGAEMGQMLGSLNSGATASVLTKMEGNRHAQPEQAAKAGVPTRIPQHEPWVRSNTAGEFDRDSLYDDDHPQAGTNGTNRNKHWKR